MPLLVDLMPSGRFLMEDFCYAGGLPAVIAALGEQLHGDAMTVTGSTLAQNNAGAPCWNTEVIRDRDHAVQKHAGIAVLRGNLAPRGAIVKPSAARPSLLRHRGRAVVFESLPDFRERIDDPNLEVDADSVLVMRGVGLRGFPGMPEVGNMPLPRKLLAQGVKDMVRISDARMSGTAYGTVILHVTPESAVGGPLALVQTGDMIELDVEARRLHLDVADEELERRMAAWTSPSAIASTGYQKLFVEHVQQADTGADFDFLVGRRGAAVPDNAH